MFDLLGLEGRVSRYRADVFMPRHKVGRQLIQEIMEPPEPPPRPKPVRMKVNRYGETRRFECGAALPHSGPRWKRDSFHKHDLSCTPELPYN